jgi:hypothetical protein
MSARTGFMMDHKSTSVLTGTVVLSFLFSQGTSPQTPGAEAGSKARESQERAATLTAMPGGSGADTHEKYPSRSEIKKLAEDYLKDLRKVIDQECQVGKQKPCPPENFIVGLVPDPLHTHLALQFDRTTEAIQEALQDDHYVYVRSLMPWGMGTHAESDRLYERLRAHWYEEEKEDYPGLMVFRGDRGLMLVLIVGETPTGGINKQQFQNSICLIAGQPVGPQCSLKDWKPESGKPGVRILGPTFSGSVESLKGLLKCGDVPCFPLVSIHSGTVRGYRQISAVDDFRKLHAYFVSFQESDEVIIERFVKYLETRRYKPDKIAILSEDETAYGGPSALDLPDLLKLYFPREISALRAAYQKEIADQDNQGRAAPRDILPFNGEVTGDDSASVPPFASGQIVLSQEGVMQGLVSELKLHHIQFVIVRATDPMDTLFVTRYVRKAYPECRVVTLTADILFRREAEDPLLHGLLSLATYSIAPASSHSDPPYKQSHVERVFPSSAAVGTYNAMRSLTTAWIDEGSRQHSDECDCRYELRRHDKPADDLGLVQYGWSSDEKAPASDPMRNYEAPPVRLLALGRDDYWQLAALGPEAMPDGHRTRLPAIRETVAATLDPLELPNSWRTIQLVGAGLALVFCLRLWRSSVYSNSQAVASYAPAFADSRAKVVLINGLALMLIILILLWPSFHFGHMQIPDYVLMAAGALVFVVAETDLLTRGFLEMGYRRSFYKSWLFAVILPLIFWRLLPYALRDELHSDRSALIRHFAAIRATQLASGLSFVMPIFFFLAVWLWWAEHVVTGYALLDERRPRLPQDMTEHLRFSSLRRVQRELVSLLKPGAWPQTKRVLLLLTLGSGLWLILDHTHPVRSLERPLWEWMPAIFLALAIGGIIGSTLTLWEIWRGLKRLLEALDSLPLRRAFSKIEGFSWKPIWRFGASTMGEFQRIVAREREVLATATNTLPTLAPAAEALDRAMQHMIKCSEIASAYKGSFVQHWIQRRKAELFLLRQFGEYQEGIAQAAAHALDYLAQRWSMERETGQALHETEVDLRSRACERFVCSIYVTFLMVTLTRIRTLIVAIAGMYVLTLIGTAQYPFEPKTAIQLVLAVLLAYVVAVVGMVFAQIHRDAILSRITDTQPGELGGDFWVRMTSFVSLPLVSLIASQFPSVNRAFYSWIQPAIEALNH